MAGGGDSTMLRAERPFPGRAGNQFKRVAFRAPGGPSRGRSARNGHFRPASRANARMLRAIRALRLRRLLLPACWG